MLINEKQFNQLFGLIKQVCSQPEHIAFKENIAHFFQEKSQRKIEQIAPKIQQYIQYSPYKKYAQSFYKNLALGDRAIKKQLKLDFIKMQEFLEANNFYNFALACAQQMEAIIKHLSNNIALNIHVNLYNKSIVAFPDFTLYKILQAPTEIHTSLKKILHYYIFYSPQKAYSSYDFHEYYSQLIFIFTARNFVHRTGTKISTESANKNIQVDKEYILNHTTKAYFRILGIFQKFIYDLSKGLKKVNARNKQYSKKVASAH